MEIKERMSDQFVSIEHIVLAMREDVRFGEPIFRGEGLTRDKLEQVSVGPFLPPLV